MDVKDKIRKLLSLATSSNENEARSALLKAKKLMMDNKLTEDDIEDRSMELRSITMDSVKWTTDSGNIWMCDLAKVIANNYLCASAWATRKGSRTHTLVVTGIGDDAEVCSKAIEFAVGVVLNNIRILQRRYRHEDSRSIKDSYAKGFIFGLEIAFDNQRQEHEEWGLVEVKPQKVQDFENNLGNKSVRSKQGNMNSLAYMTGTDDGMRFNAKGVIECT